MMITRICKKGMKDTNMNAEREKKNGRENKHVQVFFFRFLSGWFWVVTVLLIKKRCASMWVFVYSDADLLKNYCRFDSHVNFHFWNWIE